MNVIDRIIEEIQGKLPFELSHTPTLEQAAYNWLLELLGCYGDLDGGLTLLLEEVTHEEEWVAECDWYDNKKDLAALYPQAYATITPYLDRLALLKESC